ncbi:type VII secretion protein EssC [Carnobacterium maltaromaticum]|uniref:type VII secretion protein EssC n=1 Tax=Carnobacterium maltaromaticum TaxID=2751 RepID=UPI00295E5539|nr:type VII secretion protein EssC [Carnobacterium maltaromaticum]
MIFPIKLHILSLAVNFHPYDVAFLLIDYKGGGMANLFRNLPHLLGSITNLDGAQSMRALISINAELKRRQRLFSENNVNHINQYQKLYKDGDVSDPMPHLFLISDEFAELKAEQPEFMSELVSTARIGRSLGIHLILATQKPSGVVNDQIWSNSKFKLALKVADRADSMEMLKTPDAAEITQAGRAYLQVGNNEIYELFQSAWSGADYQPDKDESTAEDLTVYAINDLGQYDILSEDLSGLENADEVKTVPTELDAIIDGIQAITEKAGIEALPRPWLPPLAARISLTDISKQNYLENWNNKDRELRTVIGIVDQPQMQAQNIHEINLSKDGHLAVFGSPGFGKSTFMQSVLIGLTRQHSPEMLHAYLLDFGTNGLLSLKNYPHVADTMMVDELEKIQKFVRRMQDELKRRKKLLSEYSVADITMYERASEKSEPRIVVMLDNYDAIRADNALEALVEATLYQIGREGAGLGVHLITSGTRTGSMRAQLSANIKLQVAFFMIETSDLSSIVGRTQLKIDEIPGRGLVRIEEPALLQVALPNEGENPLEIIENNQAESAEMRANWTGNLPRPIPMVPEELPVAKLLTMPTIQKPMDSYDLLPIGIDFEFAEPIGIPLLKQNTIVLSGSNAQLKETLIPLIKIVAKKPDMMTYIFDLPAMDLLETRKEVDIYSSDTEQIGEYIEELFDEMKEREEEYLELVQDSEEAVSPLEFYQQFERKIMIFNKITEVHDSLETRTQKQLLDIAASEGRTGIGIMGGSEVPVLSKAYGDFATKLKASKSIVLTIKIGDQSIYSPSIRLLQEKPLAKYEGYIMFEGNVQKIKLVK